VPTDPVVTLAGQLAERLGDGWCDAASDGYGGAYLRQGADPDAPRLHLTVAAGRVVIAGSYPDCRYPLPYHVKQLEITVAASREPGAIAKEITRRLLPAYLPALAKVIAEDLERRRDDERRHQAAARLAAVIPRARIRDDAKHVGGYLPSTSGQVRPVDVDLGHDGGEVSLQVRWVPVDVAERVLRALIGDDELIAEAGH
jgi:hypothetical protein